MPLDSNVILDDGTIIARQTNKTAGITWQRWYHSALYALQSLAGNASAGPVSGSLSDGSGNAATVKYFNTTIAASQTAQSIVSAVTGKKIRVLELYLSTAGATTVVTLNSASTATFGPITTAANTVNPNVGYQYSPNGHFETAAGAALTGTTGTGSTVTCAGAYIEV